MAETPLAEAIVKFVRDNKLDTLEGAFEFQGSDLVKPGLGRRSRTRIEFRDDEGRCWEMYLKRYQSPGIWEKLKRLLAGKRKWCEARSEFDHICLTRKAGVPTMRAVLCGAQVDKLGIGKNYLLVTAVPGDALERVGEEFFRKYRDDHDMLDEFNSKLFRLVSRFHAAGLVHRDMYAAHIFVHEYDGLLDMNLIDLARVFKPKYRKFRWRVKDLAQLKFSMPEFWVKTYFSRFLQRYLGSASQREYDRWSKAIDKRVAGMQKQQDRRMARRRRKEQA